MPGFSTDAEPALLNIRCDPGSKSERIFILKAFWVTEAYPLHSPNLPVKYLSPPRGSEGRYKVKVVCSITLSKSFFLETWRLWRKCPYPKPPVFLRQLLFGQFLFQSSFGRFIFPSFLSLPFNKLSSSPAHFILLVLVFQCNCGLIYLPSCSKLCTFQILILSSYLCSVQFPPPIPVWQSFSVFYCPNCFRPSRNTRTHAPQ